MGEETKLPTDREKPSGALVFPRVCVGVATRNRPHLLRALLHSLAGMDTDGVHCVVVVVENCARSTVDDVVKEFAGQRPDIECVFDIEPQLGISYARNHVLDIAIRKRADMLAFIDDDETADRDWLKNLVKDKQARRLDMIGGPVRLHSLPRDASRLHRLVWGSLHAIGLKQERENLGLRARGGDGDIPLATGNWLADLEFLRKNGLSFNEALGLSGGEDTELFVKAKGLAARTGWAPHAIVHEWTPLERLTLKYQYDRSRDRAMASFHRKYPQHSFGTALRSMASAAGKTLTAALYAMRSAGDRGASLVPAAQAIGFAVGRVKASLGARSEHYREKPDPLSKPHP